MGDYLGVEYGTKVGSSFGLLDENVERKLEVSLRGSERVTSGARLDMVA